MFADFLNRLGRRETKASRTARLIALATGGRARWTPRDYAALAREGYASNAIVYRAVRLIAENVGVGCLSRSTRAAERDRHPLLNLWAAEPAPGWRVAPRGDCVASPVAGNAYVEAVGLAARRANAGARALRAAARPHEGGAGPGRLAGGLRIHGRGSTVRFEQNATPVPPILHLTLFHPLDDHYGLSAAGGGARCAIDTHNAAGRWNKALLDNAARPSGALVYAPKRGRRCSPTTSSSG